MVSNCSNCICLSVLQHFFGGGCIGHPLPSTCQLCKVNKKCSTQDQTIFFMLSIVFRGNKNSLYVQYTSIIPNAKLRAEETHTSVDISIERGRTIGLVINVVAL